ncbi:MAG: CAP domain-containing protein [Burkholderiaceae bacterium]|nr:CAP domain-containing protein [Burkholderiaceae bacterium]
MASALAPSTALAQVQVAAGRSLREALHGAGYRASASQALSVSGPSHAEAAMALLKRQYCRALLDPRYTEIGVSREGNTWLVVLATPRVSPDLGDWRQAGRQILQRVNAARAQPRTCGEKRFDAARPLAWNDELAAASLKHSRDMAQHDYFSHEARDGSRPGDRVSREGYRWRAVGENIAAGQGTAQKTVDAWLASPGHCANIMSPDFTQTGAAYAMNPDSRMVIYWTQDFGSPRSE